jgi:dienelactone hydrolase
MTIATALFSFLLAGAEPWFTPPAEFAKDLGNYRSPLQFENGKTVRNAAEWKKRRAEIMAAWHKLMGAWPPVIQKPRLEHLGEGQRRDNFTQTRVKVEVAPGNRTAEGYLAVPEGRGPFPAVLVVYYEPETSMGLKGELRDFAYQLAKRGFVTLSIGTPESQYYPSKQEVAVQPLSMLGYIGANCYQALANLPRVDPRRVGVVGHSFGGKWAMFSACLYEKFACGVWSDPGIVFDETRPNVNYWEPWYLGWDASRTRKPGVPKPDNPRTGPYRTMMETGRDLHELHALMAPRPFLVSGGSEDPPERWMALNHSIAVNALLGYRDRVAMTNRPKHPPTAESNEQIYRFFEMFLKAADAR